MNALLVLLPLLFALVACAFAGSPGSPADSVATTSRVRTGSDLLRERLPDVLRGRRVGLVTNHTGRTAEGTPSIDLLAGMRELRLVALFSPEHGIRGAAAAGERIASGTDERTGLPIHSLYGETRKPTPQMLEGIEALVFDIQDVGARPYTYVYTMALGMQAAREKGIPFVVLDRPNPINGVAVEGNMLDTAFASFVGMYPLTERHGMTPGELAQMFNREWGIGADLTVVPLEGWQRAMWWDETGLPWVNPSPNIRRLEAAIHYPGTVFFEGTNLSEGRGTDMPFEQAGAPWLRPDDVVREMTGMRLPGVRFEAVRIPVSAEGNKFPGQTIPGVRLILTDRESYRPVETSVLLIDAIRRLHPAEFAWRGAIDGSPPAVLAMDRLAGTNRLRQAIDNGTVRELLREWEADAQRFRRLREPYLLYR